MRRLLLFLIFLVSCSAQIQAQVWSTKLDKDVRFYQSTDVGVIVVGTEKSIYAVDAANGELLWRRKDVELDENDIAPVPGSDLLQLSFETGDRTPLEAVDLLTGNRI